MTEDSKNAASASIRRPYVTGSFSYGFTLLELLITMLIIGVVAAVLLPAISAIRVHSQVSSTRSMIASLDQACQAYSQDNNGLYPGQDREIIRRMGLVGAERITGTQAMVAALTGMEIATSGIWSVSATPTVYLDIDREQIDYPRDYGEINEDMNAAFDDRNGQTLSGARHTVLDAFSDPLPILYYVSRPGRAGSGIDGVFDYDDNMGDDNWLYPKDVQADEFYEMITKDNNDTDSVQLDDVMYRQDSFLIISAGKDGLYFSKDGAGNYEDLTNFNR